jgi:hypothetical protein
MRPGQQCEIENPRACRACVRRAKESDGAVHQDYGEIGMANLVYNIKRLIFRAQDRHRMTGLCYGRRPMRLTTQLR